MIIDLKCESIDKLMCAKLLKAIMNKGLKYI